MQTAIAGVELAERVYSLVSGVMGLFGKPQTIVKESIRYLDNPELVEKINESQEELHRLNQKLLKQENSYREMKAQVDGMHVQPRYVDKTLMLGPKGTGKSTFLWLRSLLGIGDSVPKPSFSAKDGTTSTVHYDDMVDTVGTSIEMDKIMRLLALLICKRSVPKSLILFSLRPIPDIVVLNHLLVSDVNVCLLQGSITHQTGEALYDARMEEEMRQRGYNVVRHDSDMPTDAGLRHAVLSLFPSGTVTAPEWEDLSQSDALPVDTARATICRYIHFLSRTELEDVDFINAPKILE